MVELDLRRNAARDPVLHALDTTVLVDLHQLGDFGRPAEVGDQFSIGHVEVPINVAFSVDPNESFNNNLFSSPTIPGMKKKTEEVHPSLVRLLEVAAEAKVVGPAALAKALNQSEQTVNNWRYADRGVSREGAMLAQQRFKVSATWIRKGTGEKMVGDLPMDQPAAPPTDGRQLAAAGQPPKVAEQSQFAPAAAPPQMPPAPPPTGCRWANHLQWKCD